MTAEERISVLLADDEPVLQRLVGRVLEREGFDVVVAGDGDAALAAFRADPERFDVVVLDLTMPPQGGGELYRAMLAERESLPAVLTSGAPPEPELRELAEARGGTFLAKPFAPEGLLAAVRRAADRS